MLKSDLNQNYTKSKKPCHQHLLMIQWCGSFNIVFVLHGMQYYSLPDVTIGGYDYASIDDQGNPSPVTMILREYRVAELNAVNGSYVLDGNIDESKFPKVF